MQNLTTSRVPAQEATTTDPLESVALSQLESLETLDISLNGAGFDIQDYSLYLDSPASDKCFDSRIESQPHLHSTPLNPPNSVPIGPFDTGPRHSSWVGNFTREMTAPATTAQSPELFSQTSPAGVSEPQQSSGPDSGYLSASGSLEFSSGKSPLLVSPEQATTSFQQPSPIPQFAASVERHEEQIVDVVDDNESHNGEDMEKENKEGLKKPKDTYVQMIAKAFIANGLKRMCLKELYAKVEDLYPFYKTSKLTWKNAIRHNLSINDCFVKVGRADSGRGYYWMIHSSCVDVFKKGTYKRREVRRRVLSMANTEFLVAPPNVTPFVQMPSNVYHQYDAPMQPYQQPQVSYAPQMAGAYQDTTSRAMQQPPPMGLNMYDGPQQINTAAMGPQNLQYPASPPPASNDYLYYPPQ